MNYDEATEKDVEKAVRRAFDMEEGKTVVVDFKEAPVRVDYRCMDKDTDVCDECRLRFTCYSSQYLILKPEVLQFPADLRETINERVEAYVESFKPMRKADE
jgi:hypothetical protein